MRARIGSPMSVPAIVHPCSTDLAVPRISLLGARLSGCSPSPEHRAKSTALGTLEFLPKTHALTDLLGVVSRCIGETKREPGAAGPDAKKRSRSAKAQVSGSLKKVPIADLLQPEHRDTGLSVVRTACARARAHLERAVDYTRTWPLPEGRPVREFCAVPLLLALATLVEVESGRDTLRAGSYRGRIPGILRRGAVSAEFLITTMRL